jgi:hypothetical protein
MKRILLASILGLALITSANADAHGYYRGGFHGGCCYRGGWIAPAIIGGAIGYGLSRPYYDPVYYPPPPIYVEPQPVIIQQQPTVQAPPAGYHWQEMVDPQTGIRKVVAVPN